MSKEKIKFLLTVNIKREDESALVYYKQDGQRFDYNCTIKMNIDTTYKFLLNFRPAQKITSASLKGTSLEISEIENTPESNTYSLLWRSNNACVSKKNIREKYPLSITVQSLGTLEVIFQFKFYKDDDKSHSVWGSGLHHIDYDCIYKPEISAFEIEKESFR